MFSFSTNTHQNLDSCIDKEYRSYGELKYVRFFSLLSIILIFAFAPVPATAPRLALPEQMQATNKMDSDPLPVLSAKQSVKPRRRPALFLPPAQDIISSNEEETKLIRRVLAPKLFSFAVIQQPNDDPYYVSTIKDLVTEFGLPKRYGVIGLMAHNHLAGNQFERLTLGQEIQIVYQDKHTDRYIVSEMHRFRALEPTNPEGQFQDLESGKMLSAAELFNRMYTGTPHVTFQTCIYSSGNNSWGRLFVIAIPVSATSEADDLNTSNN